MADFNFELLSVALLKASFERPLDLEFSGEHVKTSTSIKVTFRITEEPNSQIEVELTVEVDVPTTEGRQPMQVSATMLGIFFPHGNPPEGVVNSFGNVNGPAILYPFVREAIANLTIKGNVAPILLPTMNFAAAFDSIQKQNAKQLVPATGKKATKEKKPRASVAKPRKSQAE